MILGQSNSPNPASGAANQHNNLVESRLVHEGRERRVRRKVGPTKDKLSSLEYSILMNHPEIENETLTTKLFHCGPDNEGCLYSKLPGKRSCKVMFKALCPNIFIQKLRIIYFVLLTEAYHPLYKADAPCSQSTPGSATSISGHPILVRTSSSKMEGSLNSELSQNEFKDALDILRAKFYQDCSVDAIKRKYLAEFFQFLEYDHEQVRGQETEENIVVNIMNKYPLLDEIFIDMLILYIERACRDEGVLNIDDNFNISFFLGSVLGLESKFVSNWEFSLGKVKASIGTDMFTLDYNAQGYFHQIVESLDSNSLNNGLDVSNVGGFDEQVFNKLDMSYIHDLKDVLSNCSEGSSHFQLDNFHSIDLNQGQKSHRLPHLHDQQAGQKLGIRRVESMSFYKPAQPLRVEGTTRNQQVPSMKKSHNRTMDAVEKPPVAVEIQSNKLDLLKIKPEEKREQNPESSKNSPLPTHTAPRSQIKPFTVVKASTTLLPNTQIEIKPMINETKPAFIETKPLAVEKPNIKPPESSIPPVTSSIKSQEEHEKILASIKLQIEDAERKIQKKLSEQAPTANNEVNRSLPSQPTPPLPQQRPYQRPSFNIVRQSSSKAEEEGIKYQPYFYSRRNSQNLDAQDKSGSSQQKPSTSPMQVVRKPSIMKLPPPYIRYEAPRAPEIRQNTETASREENKNLIRQLYSEEQKMSNLPKTQEAFKYEEGKGFVQIRQKITDNSKKPIPMVVQPAHVHTQPAKVIVNEKKEPQKSFNQVCSNINQILENLKVTLKKNESLVGIGGEPSGKTEGQQMWERHKLKTSHDPLQFKKEAQRTQRPNPEQSKVYNYNINRFVINVNPTVNSSNNSYQNNSYGNPSAQSIENSNKFKVNTNYQNLTDNSKTNSFYVPPAVLDKYILQDKNRSNYRINLEDMRTTKEEKEKELAMNSQRARDGMKNIHRIDPAPSQFGMGPQDHRSREKAFYAPTEMPKYETGSNSIYYGNPTPPAQNLSSRPNFEDKKYQPAQNQPLSTQRAPAYSQYAPGNLTFNNRVKM